MLLGQVMVHTSLLEGSRHRCRLSLETRVAAKKDHGVIVLPAGERDVRVVVALIDLLVFVADVVPLIAYAVECPSLPQKVTSRSWRFRFAAITGDVVATTLAIVCVRQNANATVLLRATDLATMKAWINPQHQQCDQELAQLKVHFHLTDLAVWESARCRLLSMMLAEYFRCFGWVFLLSILCDLVSPRGIRLVPASQCLGNGLKHATYNMQYTLHTTTNAIMKCSAPAWRQRRRTVHESRSTP